ncbi:MAG: DNA helicase RecQ [Candidatus Bipolaricaulia bacterium]
MRPIDRIEEILKRYWGYESFLPLQREAMACGLSGRDSLVVLPTGGGKSLCYQVPAVRLPGMAIVVSPLISLMKDQVDGLVDSGVAADYLNSSLSASERDDVVARIRSGEVKVLYVSPERLMMDGFLRFVGEQTLSFVAVDEAHCVSMWGHDFRPEYRQLGRLKKVLPGIAIHAYTATATGHVRDDIVTQLRLDEPEVLVGSFDRPNLIYSVERRIDLVRQVCDVLDRHKDESSIVYCIRRADVDDLSEKLRSAGYRVAPYHAGLADEERKRAQEAFIQEDIDTIVATVAFGMGIDKSNVRAVIHGGMPKSLEHYQQESGRAGRDGLDAECVLLHGSGDYGIWKYIIEQSESAKARDIGLAKLGDIAAYASGVTCRHRAILQYFGQDLDSESCQACDVCFGDLELADDALVSAQKILSCVYRLDERFGADYTASVLAGSREQRILDSEHDRLSTYGLLSDLTKRLVRDWIEQLVGQGYLEKRGEYNVLKITDRGWQAMRGSETPRLLKPAARPSKRATPDSWDGVDRGLFDALRGLRRDVAREKHVPAYIVFGDAALRDMARRRPSTVDGFLDVSGVGQTKARQYGERFVAAIAEYCRSHKLDRDVDPTIRPAPKPVRRRRARATVNLSRQLAFTRFEQGESVSAVAEAIEKTKKIALEYLLDYIREDGRTSPEPWVSTQTFHRVSAASQKLGAANPRALRKTLDGETTDEDAQICLACLANVE